MSSLDRLIDLAKKTGDRLIVHDPINGRDVVIMGIEMYEDLVTGQEDFLDIPGFDFQDESDEDNLSNEEAGASPWHSAGSVLNVRYKDSDDWSESEEDGDGDVFGDWDTTDLEQEPSPLPPAPIDDFGNDTKQNNWEEVSSTFGLEDSSWENSQPEPVLESVPFVPVVGSNNTWEEEPLAIDEPVFYEEPV